MTPPQHTDRRAQTTLDFAIAMGVFLLAVAFVFTFIPSLTAPFVDGNQEQSAVADRVASNLVEGSLADPDRPYVLNVTCTTGFFEERNDSTTADCGYTNEVAEYEQRVGVHPRTNLNITIARIDAATRDRTTLCFDKDNDNLVNTTDPECGSTDVTYRKGEDHANAESVTVARRIVSIDGDDVTMIVRVW